MSAERQEPLDHAGPNTLRAAAVLVGLGRDVAQSVFRHLSEGEVRRIALGAKQLRSAPPRAVPDALKTFVDAMGAISVDAAVGDDLLQQWAAEALGPEVARRAFEGVPPPVPPDEMLGPVAQAEPESLAMVLSREHPQTIALVLSALEPERAVAVMELIPEELHSAIMLRMATVEGVVPELLREVGQALAGELRATSAGGLRKVDGRSAALEILRRRPSAKQTAVVDEIEKADAALAGELRSKLFTFDDIVHLTDRDVQTLLKEFDASVLSVALKGSSTAVSEKILRNMSTRAAQMLRDDLAAMGPVRLSDVEKAQEALVKVITAQAKNGRITVVGPADKMV
ncbi:MAG: flagellar motor switch protein FliG [Myxococcota bacterium]